MADRRGTGPSDPGRIQPGAGGRAGRGSRTSPSAAARNLAGPRAPRATRLARPPVEPVDLVDPADPIDPADPVEPVDPADPLEEPTPPPRRDGPRPDPTDPDLTRMLTELGAVLAGAYGAVRDQLGDLPSGPLRELAGDPLAAALGLAQRLGVRWPDSVTDVAEYARSRFRGDYAIDEFGFDPEFTENVFLPILRPLARDWFRVELRGVENLPTAGAALLVSNHAGTLPLDAMVLQTVVHDAIGRHVRTLGADLVFKTPYSHDLARKTGTTLACQEDAERLLTSDQLVAVFPEGFKGLGKSYADRYKLQRFGRGGFVSAALRAQVPVVPISIVGSEEIYPMLSNASTLARALNVPYFPLTPLFPWFGLLGLVPLPSKWIIQFGEVIATDELPAGAADDPMMVFEVTDQVRETIQHALYALLMDRRSPFF